MPHPLEQRIAETRRQARRLSLSHGLGWVLGSLVAAVLVLSLADYCIHFNDPGIRTLATLAVLLVLGWSLYRYLLPVLGAPLGDVDIAQKIERRFPALDDRLSSSVEFLKQSGDDRQAGSAALRRAVIVDTTAAVERLNLSDVLEQRPARRAVAGACALLGLAAVLMVADPLSARVALARLLKPLGSDAWPRQHELAFRNPPERVAAGQTFEVELEDRRGGLPDQVWIHYLYEGDGQRTEEVEPMHLLDGLMVARKDNVARPFAYRAAGGDDQSMQWIYLDVVEPPRVESFRATLYPPAYTGWPAEQAENNLQALRGTRVAFHGTTTKPIRSAKLRQSDGPALAAVVAADGLSFELAADAPEPLVVDKSGPYWFELEDIDGLVGGQDSRWEIRAVTDQAPSVNVEQPGANVFVTPTAVVPLRIVAKDDLAIHDVALHISRSDAAEVDDQVVALYTGLERAQTETTSLAGGLPGDSRLVEYQLDVAALDLKPGSQASFYVAASDYLPQTGRSTARRLIIITPQELDNRLAQRQGLILGELRRVLKMQQETRGQTTALEIQLKELGQLGKQDIDHAQGAELSQRQVTRTLTSDSEGIPAQIADLLGDLESNRVDNADVARRMQGILEQIGRLEDEHLAPIERELTTVIKGAQADLAAGDKRNPQQTPAVAGALAEAAQHQDEVIRSLEGMLDNLSEWDSYRRFGRDLAQVEHEQDELERASKQLAGKTLGKDLKDLDTQQQADLKKLSKRQSELGRRFDKLLQEMDEVRGRLEESDPLPSATIADALHQARQQGTSGQMRSAGNQLERNQLGQAGAAQEQVRKALSEMLDILANRREHELGRLVKKLREAEQQLADLRQQQEGLRKKQAAAAADRDDKGQPKTEAQRRELERLDRQQRKVQAEIERLARRLERLQAEQAGRSASAAANSLARSSEAGEQGDRQSSDDLAERAQKDLEEAQQKLAERRKEAEADLAREQMARLQDALKGLQERQTQVLVETQRLDGLRGPEGQWTRAQSASVRSLAREQKAVEVETRSQAEKLASAEAFLLALKNASREMARAGDELERAETGAVTQAAEQAALARFAAVLEALKPSGAKGKKEGQQGGEGQGKPGGSGNAIRMISELKLLRLMQEEVNRRFHELAETRPPDAESQRALLREEQGHLADIALKLSQPTEANPEDKPDELPDIRRPAEGPGALEDALLPKQGEE